MALKKKKKKTFNPKGDIKQVKPVQKALNAILNQNNNKTKEKKCKEVKGFYLLLEVTKHLISHANSLFKNSFFVFKLKENAARKMGVRS
jgi:hypothetical protein